jgi:hypothetical protein
VTMQDPGPAQSTITEGAMNQTFGWFEARDNFAFNFDRFGHHTTMDFHPHSDGLQFDESMFANAQAILNALHDEGHGEPVAAVDGHETTPVGALKAHLHAADFHFI